MIKTEIINTPTTFLFNGSEMGIQQHIQDNVKDISKNCQWGDIERIIPNGRLSSKHGIGIYDLLIIHSNQTATLIEVKKYKSEQLILAAIGQILFYGSLVKVHYDAFPRLVIASNYIPATVQYIIKLNNLNIRLLQVDGNEITYL